MAFNPALLFKLQPSSLFTQPATIPGIGTQKYTPQLWTYNSNTDNAATVEAAGYFVYYADFVSSLLYNNGQYLAVGDLIYCVCNDANVWLEVTAIGSSITTVVMPVSANSVAQASLQANIVDSAQTNVGFLQRATVAMTAAQWNGMYAAPFQIIAAPGAGKVLSVTKWFASMTFVSASYAAGGAVALQYDNTVHGAGVAATATFAAATVNGFIASGQIGSTCAMAGGANANKGIFISNATGAFTTGDSTWNVEVWYSINTL